nr:hypothetical protein [Tanacetum cinerariifolium]
IWVSPTETYGWHAGIEVGVHITFLGSRDELLEFELASDYGFGFISRRLIS